MIRGTLTRGGLAYVGMFLVMDGVDLVRRVYRELRIGIGGRGGGVLTPSSTNGVIYFLKLT